MKLWLAGYILPKELKADKNTNAKQKDSCFPFSDSCPKRTNAFLPLDSEINSYIFMTTPHLFLFFLLKLR